MNAPSIPRAGLYALVSAAILGLGCGDGEDRQPRQESADRNHTRDEQQQQQREREVVNLVPDPGDAPTRRGVEPAPARGEASDWSAAHPLPESREVFIAQATARLAELDRELDEVRLQAQARAQSMPEHVLEQRQVVARQFDALLRAPEEDWRDLRDQLAERLNELAYAIEQAQVTKAGVPHSASPSAP